MSSKGKAPKQAAFVSGSTAHNHSGPSSGDKPFLVKRQCQPPVLITGGAGFIGTNLADQFLSEGQPVIVYDNLSRRGSETNLEWLSQKHHSLLQVVLGDVRSHERLQSVVQQAKAIFHFAAQVAVTESLLDPRLDFEVNVRGTINLLEAIRATRHRPPLLFTSTNKVYGSLCQLPLIKTDAGYSSITQPNGIDESQPLDFLSPYGCSKGAADQYVLDYARSFGLRSVVFRMSCIYGPHQFGNEDQGWIAHFLIRAREGKPITIYGDGLQVRDVLFIGDLLNAFSLALQHMDEISGQPFNIGGGSSNTLSLLELIEILEEFEGHPCKVAYADWRHADQRYFVSCADKFKAATGWQPKVSPRDGVAALLRWLKQQPRADRKLPLEMSVVPRRSAEFESSTDAAQSELRRL